MTHLTAPVSDLDFSQGPKNAPITLVEYGDYDCPHCKRTYQIVEDLRHRLGERLLFVYRPFPRLVPNSPGVRAAEAAFAAGVQGRFWEMHFLLLRPNAQLGDGDLLAMPLMYRDTLFLDEDQFVRDFTSSVFAERVSEHVHAGVASGVESTPTFFINGIRHDDYWDEETLFAAIRAVESGVTAELARLPVPVDPAG